MSFWPEDGRPYVALGKIFSKQSKMDDARLVYERGCQATQGENSYIWQVSINSVVCYSFQPLVIFRINHNRQCSYILPVYHMICCCIVSIKVAIKHNGGKKVQHLRHMLRNIWQLIGLYYSSPLLHGIFE